MEMEVDKEPMDLNNSSRSSFATTELVDSPIFTTFHFVFCDFFFYLTSNTPDTILHIHSFKPSHIFTLHFSHSANCKSLLYLNKTFICNKFSCVQFPLSDFYHFHTKFQALNFSIHVCS